MVYEVPPFNGYGRGNNDFGVRWRDAFGNIRQTSRTGIVEEAYRDTGHVLDFTRHNQDGAFGNELQINHDWDLNTPIRVHIHTLPMANGAGNAYWVWQYYVLPVNAPLPAVASWTSGTTTQALVAADQYDHRPFQLFEVTPVGANASSILLFNVTRESTNVLDTYDTNKDHGTVSANLAILYIDAHYQLGRPGTATEYV